MEARQLISILTLNRAKNNKPIPGLYAVGEVADDGLFGTGPTHINVYFGKKAAENVLKEMK